MANVPFTVYRFYTEFRDDKAGGFVPIDWVEYGPFGSDKTRNVDKVSRLLNIHDNPTNPASKLAKVRAEVIRKHYEAWKSGQELSPDGTPLAAWNGVTPEQADVLRTKGFKTIEDVAAMTDTHRQNVPLPGLLRIIADAKRFLEAADSSKVAAELAARDEEQARLRAELEESKAQQNEMARMLEELLAERRNRVVEEGASDKRGRKAREAA
jgi:hypothetical protein